MPENLFKDVIFGSLDLEAVKAWLSSQESADSTSNFGCLRSDFILYLLNYLHDLIARPHGEEASIGTPLKIKFLRNETEKNPRRVELFPKLGDSSDGTNSADSPRCFDSSQSPLASPLSPPEPRRRSTPRQRTCLADYVPGGGQESPRWSAARPRRGDRRTSTSSRNSSRRITPTSVQPSRAQAAFENSYSFVAEPGPGPGPAPALGMEQEARLRSREIDAGVLEAVLARGKATTEPQVAEPGLVERPRPLARLLELYSHLLEAQLVLNAMTELYFLVCAVSGRCSAPGVDQHLLGSVHNAAWFAARALQRAQHLVRQLDRPTQRLLADNASLERFAPGFGRLLLGPPGQSERSADPGSAQSTPKNVCFISELDNRPNFPSDGSFHAFRKQRDVFHEVLRAWEVGHMRQGWCFETALAGKVRMLVGLRQESTNYLHLARLVKNSLLGNCRTPLSDIDKLENSLSVLPQLPNLNVEKLSLLQNRLVTRSYRGGSAITEPPAFLGNEEFFCNFLVHSQGTHFARHFTDVLVEELDELNATEFTPEIDESGGEAEVDTATRRAFATCLRKLRVLAKFLGFTEALPYTNDRNPPPAHILAAQISSRSHTSAAVDILSKVEDGLRRRRLCLVVPWVAEYLAQLDYVGLRLPALRPGLEALFEARLAAPPNRTGLLVQLCLGWLLEQDRFPTELFFEWLSAGRRLPANACSPPTGRTMDSLSLVDLDLLYACCPYLEELKVILRADGCRVSIKHIRPVSARPTAAPAAGRRLEEAFFASQPASTRKTCDFVADRVASACLKHVCVEVVPPVKRQHLQAFEAGLAAEKAGEEAAAAACADELLLAARAASEGMVGPRIRACIAALLPVDTLELTVVTCCALTERICWERVEQWLAAHLNAGVLLKDFENEVRKHEKKYSESKPEAESKTFWTVPSAGRSGRSGESCQEAAYPSPAKILAEIRDISCDLLESPGFLAAGDLERLLAAAEGCCLHRSDASNGTSLQIAANLLDLVVIATSCRPELCHDLGQPLARLWRQLEPSAVPTVMSGKNVKLLCCSRNPEQALKSFGGVLAALLHQGALNSSVVEEQCLALFGAGSWPPEVLRYLSSFLRDLVDSCKHRQDDRLVFLLTWFAGACADMEGFGPE